MLRKRKKIRRSRQDSPHRLVGLESLEGRRLLACTPGGGDGNDQICEAAELLPGFFRTGTIATSLDVDMFELQTGLATGISLDFEFDVAATDGNFDPFLRLFDDDGNELAFDDDGGNGLDSRIVITLPSPGTYFLGVSAFTNKFYSAENGTGDTSSGNSTSIGTYVIAASDNNDAIGEALPVLAGQTRTGFANRHDFDVDMFKIDVNDEFSGNRQFTFELEATAASSFDPHLRLFDSSGIELADADNNVFTSLADITFTFPSNGTFFLGASADENEDYDPITGDDDETGNSTGGYTISASDNNDEIDEIEAAIPVPAIRAAKIDLPTDVDLFRVDGFQGQPVQIDVFGDNGFDTFLRVFDDNGNPLASNDDVTFGNSDSRLAFTFPDTGDFYIGISGHGNSSYDPEDGDTGGSGDTGPYTLQLSDLDPDDQITEAIDAGNINAGVFEQNDEIESDVAVDLYQFTLTTATIVHIDIDLTLPGQLNSHVRLFNSSGTQIAFNNNGNAPDEVALFPTDSYIGKFLTPGTYYVGVSGQGNDSYNINSGNGDTQGDSGTGGAFGGEYRIRIQQGLEVNTTEDVVNYNDNILSLREAIETANVTPGAQTITFKPSVFGTAKTITLAGQALDDDQLEITDDLTIIGPGANLLSISGDDDNRVLLIDDEDNSSEIDVVITGVKIRDGNTAPSIINVGGDFGAGIRNRENLTLINVAVTSNTSYRFGALGFVDQKDGGGIYHSLGILNIFDSTINGNTALNGGGIYVFSGSAEITNTTVSGNSASNIAGGLITNFGDTIVRNSTFTGNRADADGDGNGTSGGVFGNSGKLTMHNSIVAGNFEGTGASPNDVDNFAFVSGSSHNLIASAVVGQGGLTDGVNGNILGINGAGTIPIATILNTTLADNGGPAKTHALIFGSPAINAGSDSLVPSGVVSDQRGEDRIKIGRVDLGAFESDFEPRSLVVTTTDDTEASDGETSLREAIAFANDTGAGLAGTGDADNDGNANDTITFDTTGVFATPQTITLVGSQLAITDSVTIVGTGADQLDISGNNGAHRVFNIDDLDNGNLLDVQISGVTIRDGGDGVVSVLGAGIFNAENLTLRNVSVDSSNAGPTGTGGGLNHAHGTLDIADSVFSSNTAGQGGGLELDSGTATIVNTTISGNSSAGPGGGVIVVATSTVFRNATITGNRSNSDDSGGGNGGGMGANIGTTTIHNSLIAGNFFGSGTSTPNDLSSNSMVLTSSFNLIGAATAFLGGLIDGTNGNIVGIDGSGTIPIAVILNTTLDDNGGPTKTHALVTGSPAINAGDNAEAVGVDGTTALTTDQRGQTRIQIDTVDIGAFESAFEPRSLVVTTANDTVANDGQTSLREAIAFANDPTAGVAADGDADNDGNANDTVTFTAALNGQTVNVTAGELSVTESLTIAGLGQDQLTIRGDQISRLFNVTLVAEESFAVEDITLQNGGNGTTRGGAIHSANPADIFVTRSRLTGHHGSTGGAIRSSGNVTIDNSSLSGNTAVNRGGAISIVGGTLNVLNSSTLGGVTASEANHADDGGAIVAESNAVVMIDASTISGNTADNFGGAILVSGGTLTVRRGSVLGGATTAEGNDAANDGGAIFAQNSAVVTIDASTISGNTADDKGGAVFVALSSVGSLTIVNSTFSGNSAKDRAGALNAESPTVIRNSTFTGNRADSDGDGTGAQGGIFTLSNSITMHNTIVAGNFKGTDTTPSDLDTANVVASSSHNLIGSAVGGAGGLTDGANGNIVGVGGTGTIPTNTIVNTTLANNGGPTLTHALVPGGPAIDAGDNTQAIDADGIALTSDQRGSGFARRVDGDGDGTATVDIGAVEDAKARVVAVKIGGTGWHENFVNAIDPQGHGYVLPTGADQLDDVPFVNANQLFIGFNQPVTGFGGAALQPSDFQLIGSPTLGNTYTIQNPVGYDTQTNTAILSFVGDFTRDKLLLHIPDGNIVGSSGGLDGDWETEVSLASGDGTAGGAFNFRFDVLPGNVNDDQLTNTTDISFVRSLGTQIAGSTPGFDARANLNGDPLVSTTDISALRALGTQFLFDLSDPVPPASALFALAAAFDADSDDDDRPAQKLLARQLRPLVIGDLIRRRAIALERHDPMANIDAIDQVHRELAENNDDQKNDDMSLQLDLFVS